MGYNQTLSLILLIRTRGVDMLPYSKTNKNDWGLIQSLTVVCQFLKAKPDIRNVCVFVSGVRAEEAPRGRVPPEDGRALWMHPLHSELSQGLFTRCSNKTAATVTWLYADCGNLMFFGSISMLTLWQTCWTSGGCFAPGSSGNPVFSTEETTSKTSAGWAESSVKSSS